jgi:gluconate 5-dehydrogenase
LTAPRQLMSQSGHGLCAGYHRIPTDYSRSTTAVVWRINTSQGNASYFYTGASRGLGFAMAEALAEVGATVILNGRDANTLKIVAGRICDRGLSAETSAFDVTDRRAADSAIQSIVAHHQRLDILIANAGITHRAQLADWTEEAWNSVLAANLSACFFLAQSAAAPMRAKGMDE